MKRLLVFILLISIFVTGCGSKKPKESIPPSEPPVSATPSEEPSAEPVYVRVGTVHDVDTYLNIRSGPGTDFDILGSAKQGEKLLILTEFYSANWHQVEFQGGIAYIHANYLSIADEPIE